MNKYRNIRRKKKKKRIRGSERWRDQMENENTEFTKEAGTIYHRNEDKCERSTNEKTLLISQ